MLRPIRLQRDGGIWISAGLHCIYTFGHMCTVIHLYGLHYQQYEFELRMKTWHNVLVNARLVHVKFGLSGLPSS